MGRRYRYQDGEEALDYWGFGRGRRGRGSGRPAPRAFGGRPAGRVEVYFCPRCHEPCESARDVREHLADCAAAAAAWPSLTAERVH